MRDKGLSSRLSFDGSNSREYRNAFPDTLNCRDSTCGTADPDKCLQNLSNDISIADSIDEYVVFLVPDFDIGVKANRGYA